MTATDSNLRHFVEVPATDDVRAFIGAVFVACDVEPAFWVMNTSGDLVPASASDADRLERLIGKPVYRPAPKPNILEPNPIKEALRQAEEEERRRNLPQSEWQF